MKETLRVGKSLYRYHRFNGFADYEVKEIKNVGKIILYLIECKSCTKDHPTCNIYVIEINENRYRFVEMSDRNLPEYDGDDEKVVRDYHTGEDFYFPKKSAAMREKYSSEIKKKEMVIEEVREKYKEKMKDLRESLFSLQEHFENIFEDDLPKKMTGE